MIWLIIGSNVASFVLALFVGYFISKHKFEQEQILRDAQLKNTQMWTEYLEKLGGAK